MELENFKERNSSHSLHLHHSFQTLKNLKLPAMLFDPIFCQIWLTKVSSRHFTALQNISWHFMAFLRKASFGNFHIFCINFRGLHNASWHNLRIFFMTQILKFQCINNDTSQHFMALQIWKRFLWCFFHLCFIIFWILEKK